MHVDIFSTMTTAQKQAALAAAQQAYVQLCSGAKGVSFSYTQGDGGKSVTYTASEPGQVVLLIKQLQQSLGMLPRVRRPIRFSW